MSAKQRVGVELTSILVAPAMSAKVLGEHAWTPAPLRRRDAAVRASSRAALDRRLDAEVVGKVGAGPDEGGEGVEAMAFRSAGPILLVLFAVSGILGQHRSADVPWALMNTTTFFGRLFADRMADQERARLLFSRILVTTELWGWLAIVLWLHYHPPEPLSANMVPFISALFFLLPVYLHLSAIHTVHRLAVLAVRSHALATLPAVSVVGQPAESLICGVAMLLGEFFGYNLHGISCAAESDM